MIRPPYRVPAPAAADLVRWPDGWGRRYTVFCDVEEEFDWSAPLARAARATTAMRAFPDAHRRFAARGVGLACMVDWPVVRDPAAVDSLACAAADPRSEIGAQLHAWVNPPFGGPSGPAASYAGNLPRALEAAKLDRLTEALTRTFGRAPRAYRAGRYGVGPDTRALLAARGYRIDSSVRAAYDYSADGGPDFRAVGNAAHRADGVVELPLSTVFTGWGRAGAARLDRALARVRHGRGLAARLRLLQRVALTPEDMPVAAALAAVQAAAAGGERLLVLSFHSPSLEPGHTPYVRDAADLRRFWEWWDAVLDRLDRLGVRFASVDEVIAAAG